jgi:hypothetical protein
MASLGEHSADHRPPLEDRLVSSLPLGILGAVGQRCINHHGQVGVVLKADGYAVKIRVEAQLNLFHRAPPGLRELHQTSVGSITAGLLRGFLIGLLWHSEILSLCHF